MEEFPAYQALLPLQMRLAPQVGAEGHTKRVLAKEPSLAEISEGEYRDLFR